MGPLRSNRTAETAVAPASSVPSSSLKVSPSQCVRLQFLPPPAGARPAQPLARYAGTYRNDYLGEAQVTVSGDALQLHMGPAGGGKNWSLTHWDGGTFKLLLGTDDANATAVSAVRFDLSGPKATLWLEYYDGTSKGRGTLSRADRPARKRRPA